MCCVCRRRVDSRARSSCGFGGANWSLFSPCYYLPFLLPLTVIILVFFLLKTAELCVQGAAHTLAMAIISPRLPFVRGEKKEPEQAVGVVSLGLASQLARTATKTSVRRRAAPFVKNSLSPSVAAWWSWCAPRLSVSMQRADPEHHSRA